jgi:uncharacterized protein
MFLSVKQLEIRKVEFDESFQPGEIDFTDAEVRQASPLVTAGVARMLPNSGGQIRVQGTFRVDLETECDRCLGPAGFHLEDRYDLFYHPSADEPGSDEVEIDAGGAEIAFYEGEGLELKEVVKEQVLLSLPMQRVCRDDCRGICPVCGSNRNDVPCSCEVKPADDRWGALRNFRV